MAEVEEFAREGGLVLGICNGFQVLCEAGLLPGALLPNVSLKFVFRQVELEVVRAEGPFTGLRFDPPTAPRRLPAAVDPGQAHDRPLLRPRRQLDRLEAAGQVLLRYAPGHNPNGSLRDIAGVRNEPGNVFGLMPHPEHAVDPLGGSTDGLTIFESMRAHVEQHVLA